jgi:hypothetical protein
MKKICELCNEEFIISNTKRDRQKRFCNRICSTRHMGLNNKGRQRSQEWKHMMSRRNSGSNNPFYGRKHSEEFKQQLSDKRKGISYEEKYGIKKAQLLSNAHSERMTGEGNPFYGRQHSWETRIKISKNHADMKRENNPAWCGGLSDQKYPSRWNRILRETIRRRDNYICAICFCFGIDVHHIDYDKFNCNENNLITLCRNCHIKTNFKRDYWKNYFIQGIK